jgi:DNA-binding MarR family transcriptional regulator
MRLLWSIEHGLQKTSKRMNASLGITGPQRLVLLVVERFPGLTAGELAAVVHLHPSTVTGILQRLSARKLINASRDKADGRRLRLTIRPKALQYTKKTAGPVEGAVRDALKKVGDARARTAGRVLSEIAQRLDGYAD